MNTLGLPRAVEGKTYAEAAKYIEKLFQGRNSKIDLDTKKIMMERLRNAQEADKQEMQEKQTEDQTINAFKMGGYTTRQAKKIVAMQKTYGGLVNPFVNGGLDIEPDYTTEMNSIEAPKQNFLDTYIQKGLDARTLGDKISYGWNQATDWAKKNKSQILSTAGTVGTFGAMAAPILGNIIAAKNLKKEPDMQAYTIDENVTPETVNRQQLLRNADEQAASQRYFINQTGGNLAQKSAMMANLNASKIGQTGNLMLQADLADANERIRAQQTRIGLKQFNIGQRSRVDELNAQNRARYEDQRLALNLATWKNIGNIGESVFNYKQAQDYAAQMKSVYAFMAGADQRYAQNKQGGHN